MGSDDQRQTQKQSDRVFDARERHVFMPARFDDLNLTLEAFRVYCHLSRRTNKETRTAYPSYAKIGEICFRGSYPNSSKASLKAKAIAAVNELIEFGLIRKELQDEDDGYSHNVYHLTGQNEWMTPGKVDNCNVRKGRGGMKRKSVNGDNPPNSVFPVNPVNGEYQGRLTGNTDPVNRDANSVNPTPPKGLNTEGTPNKVLQIEGVSCFEAQDTISHPKDFSELIQAESDGSKSTASLSNDSDFNEAEKDSVEDKSVARKKREKRKKQSVAEVDIYSRLQYPEKFESFWSYICRKYAEAPTDRTGKKPAPGNKKEAAGAWLEHIEHAGKLEDLQQACRVSTLVGAFNQVGLPHVFRWLRDGHFENAITQWKAINGQQSDNEFVVEQNARVYVEAPEEPARPVLTEEEIAERDKIIADGRAALLKANAEFKERTRFGSRVSLRVPVAELSGRSSNGI
jgi:hypothetical protein